jgi:CubicO group peptidase (beta-lactamase class C family)
VVRRVRGKKIGDVVREEIARPLAAEFEIGFGPELDARVSPLVQGPIHPPQDGTDFDLAKAVLENPESILAKTFANPPALMPGLVNKRAWRAAEIPGANGHSNAHSLARIYAPLANGGRAFGVRLLSNEAIERARTEQVCGPDAVLSLVTRSRSASSGRAERAARPEPARVRSWRGGWVVQPRRSRAPALVRLCDEPHAHGHLAGRPRARRLLASVYDCASDTGSTS